MATTFPSTADETIAQYLIEAASLGLSPGRRQIAQHFDVGEGTVRVVLDRLIEQGVLFYEGDADGPGRKIRQGNNLRVLRRIMSRGAARRAWRTGGRLTCRGIAWLLVEDPFTTDVEATSLEQRVTRSLVHKRPEPTAPNPLYWARDAWDALRGEYEAILPDEPPPEPTYRVCLRGIRAEKPSVVWRHREEPLGVWHFESSDRFEPRVELDLVSFQAVGIYSLGVLPNSRDTEYAGSERIPVHFELVEPGAQSDERYWRDLYQRTLAGYEAQERLIRPEPSPFSWRVSPVARVLLCDGRAVERDALDRQTGLPPTVVREAVDSLVAGEFVSLERRSLAVSEPDALLSSWSESYRFSDHVVVRASIAAREGSEATHRISARLTEAGLEHAFSGLAAAWQYTRHAAYRLTTLYVRTDADVARVLEIAQLRQVEWGENVWLLVPVDDWVFYDSRVIEGIKVVHPVQAFLDLGAHPERSAEARDELRRYLGYSRSE